MSEFEGVLWLMCFLEEQHVGWSEWVASEVPYPKCVREFLDLKISSEDDHFQSVLKNMILIDQCCKYLHIQKIEKVYRNKVVELDKSIRMLWP